MSATAARAMLSRESESSAKKKSSKGLRVNEPGDAYEREADRVAETVSKGGRIPGWSLSVSAAGQIQRDTDTAASLPAQQPIRQIGDPQNPPAPNNYGDALGKIAEAFLKTPAAATLIKLLTDQPVVKDVKGFRRDPGRHRRSRQYGGCGHHRPCRRRQGTSRPVARHPAGQALSRPQDEDRRRRVHSTIPRKARWCSPLEQRRPRKRRVARRNRKNIARKRHAWPTISNSAPVPTRARSAPSLRQQPSSNRQMTSSPKTTQCSA
jgi:hypothetical protein